MNFTFVLIPFIFTSLLAVTFPLYTLGKKFNFRRDSYSSLAIGKHRTLFKFIFTLPYITNFAYWFVQYRLGSFEINNFILIMLLVVFISGLLYVWVDVKMNSLIHNLAAALYLLFVPAIMLVVGIQNEVLFGMSVFLGVSLLLLMTLSTRVSPKHSFTVVLNTLFLIAWESFLILR